MIAYRIERMTSWTIYIEVDGDIIYGRTTNSVQVTDNIRVDISTAIGLDEDEKRLIIEGIKWVLNHIPDSKEITIFIKQVNFNVCDYQKEGLFFAIANWLSKKFRFDMPKYEIKFNKKINKYEFHVLN